MSEIAQKKRFRQIYIEITNRCNLACSFCPGTVRSPADMDLPLFSHIAAQAAPLADQVYLHLMGEPLMHPAFAEIIRICDELHLPAAVTTNGTLLDSPAGEALLSSAVRQVNISAHALSLDADTERILRFAVRAAQERPELYINLRLWDKDDASGDQDSARRKDLVERLERALGVEIATGGDHPWRKNRRLAGRIYLHIDTRFQWPGVSAEEARGFCHGLGTHCGILADGTVVPCCLDHDGIIALGNARIETLSAIINSPRARAIKAGFDRGELVEDLCRHCSFIRRFDKRI